MSISQPPVTVVIPVKNEEKNLPACLERLKRFPEILVVDSNSTDRTREIAAEHGAEVLQFEWNGKFPKKRNWTLDTYDFGSEWVLFLDADEFISDAFVDELCRKLENTSHVGFWLNFENYFFDGRLRHGDVFSKLALFKIATGRYEKIEEDSWSHLDMEVHEHPILTGTVGEIATKIRHDDYRGLHHYIAKHNEYSSWEANRYLALRDGGEAKMNALTPRQRTKYKHITKFWFPLAFFLATYIFRRGFLDGRAGFHFAVMKAIYFHQIRMKIKELERERSTN
jgi:glycosyltransferase involved in cell wall biosynthesis